MIVIHTFARAVRGWRVVWQCEEMGLPYRVEMVAFPPGDAYRALNPLGSVPFLEDQDGVAINESVAMMLYLAQKYGPTPLLPDSDHPRFARVLQMTVFGETAIGMSINPIVEARFLAPDDDKRNWSVRAQETRVDKAVRYLDGILGDDRYLAGAELTLADISVGSMLGMWTGTLGHPLPDRLVAYRARLASRPAYQRAFPPR